MFELFHFKVKSCLCERLEAADHVPRAAVAVRGEDLQRERQSSETARAGRRSVKRGDASTAPRGVC